MDAPPHVLQPLVGPRPVAWALSSPEVALAMKLTAQHLCQPSLSYYQGLAFVLRSKIPWKALSEGLGLLALVHPVPRPTSNQRLTDSSDCHK